MLSVTVDASSSTGLSLRSEVFSLPYVSISIHGQVGLSFLPRHH